MKQLTALPRQFWIWTLFIIAISVIGVFLLGSEWLRNFGITYAKVYLGKLRSMTPFIVAAILSTICVLIVELLVVGWKKSSLASLIRPDKSLFNDVFLWFIEMSQIGFIMIYILTFGVFAKLRPVIRDTLGLDSQLIASVASPVFQVLLFAILIDFLAYALHYVIHHTPQLWVFHKVHHATAEFAVVTVSRVHPVERYLLSDIFFLIPLAIVGVPAEYVVVYAILRFFIATLHHSKLNWDWGWFGRYVIASPQYHRLHHSKLPQHYDKNLAVMLPIWDHLFGTYCHERINVGEVGLNDNPYNRKNVIHDFFLSFGEFWDSLISPKVRRM